MKDHAAAAMTGTMAASGLFRTSFGFLAFRIFPILQAYEKRGLKKSFKKVKNFLDKFLFYDIVRGIEKCAPIQSGRFAF